MKVLLLTYLSIKKDQSIIIEIEMKIETKTEGMEAIVDLLRKESKTHL